MAKQIHPSSFVLCIFELAAGILLLASPLRFTSAVLFLAGAALLAAGILQVFYYVRTDPLISCQGNRLALGIAFLAAGSFLIFRRAAIVSVLAYLAAFYGLFCFTAGLQQMQWGVDMFRLKLDRWYVPIAGALLNLVCGIVIWKNPFQASGSLWRFTGIFYVLAALVGLASLFMGAGRRRGPSSRPMRNRPSAGSQPPMQAPMQVSAPARPSAQTGQGSRTQVPAAINRPAAKPNPAQQPARSVRTASGQRPEETIQTIQLSKTQPSSGNVTRDGAGVQPDARRSKAVPVKPVQGTGAQQSARPAQVQASQGPSPQQKPRSAQSPNAEQSVQPAAEPSAQPAAAKHSKIALFKSRK